MSAVRIIRRYWWKRVRGPGERFAKFLARMWWPRKRPRAKRR